MKRIIVVLIIISVDIFTSYSQGNIKNIEVQPKGIYLEIDVSRHNEAIGNLNGSDKILKQETIEKVLNNPNFYNPPVLYAISRELYKQDKKDDATYWFYIAQLRARLDANLCLDNSAKQAVAVLNNEYGPDINNYSFLDIDKLEKIITKVVQFVRTNEENYDHRWINLHGMQAIISGMDDNAAKKELIKEKAKWKEIKKKTVDDYYEGFIEYVVKKK